MAAEEKSQQQSPSKSPIFVWTTAGIMVAFLMMMVVAGFGSSTSGNQGPNPFGAQAAQTIDPSDPATRDLIDQMKVFTDKDSVLANIQALQSIKETLKKIVAKDPAYATLTSNPDSIILAQRMLDEIKVITGDPRSTAAQKAAQNFVNDRKKLLDMANSYHGPIAQIPIGGFAYPIDLQSVTGFAKTPHTVGPSGHGPFLNGPDVYAATAARDGLIGNVSAGVCLSCTDVDARVDTNIYAPFSGKITSVKDHIGIVLDLVSDDKNLAAAIGHLNLTGHPLKGQTVSAGQIIGTLCDKTVRSSCPSQAHLHFELWVKGHPVNGPRTSKSSLQNESTWKADLTAMGLPLP